VEPTLSEAEPPLDLFGWIKRKAEQDRSILKETKRR
jgi:hypothetical protein